MASSPEAARNLCAFWFLGLVNNFSYVVMFSAAEDIIEGASGAVLLADIVPTLLIKATAPFWAHAISYRGRILACTLFAFLSFYLVASMPSIWLKLLGVVCASISSGWGEVTCLAMTSFYHKSTVTAWSSGTGFAGIAGAGWYLLLTSVFNLTPETTLYLGGVWPIVYLLTYFAVLRPPQSAVGAEREVVEMQLVPTDSTELGGGGTSPDLQPVTTDAGLAGSQQDAAAATLDQDQLLTGPHSSDAIDDPLDPAAAGRQLQSNAITQTLSVKERIAFLRPLAPYMVPLCIVYFSEYTINSGVNSTLAFSDMSRGTYFVAAGFVYQVGVFISRSSASVYPLKKLWPMPVLQFATLVFFVLQSLLQFLPSAYIALCFNLWEGLLGGATYVNAFYLISQEVQPEYREFALGAASLADTSGIVLAATVSLFLECALLRYNGLDTANCVY